MAFDGDVSTKDTAQLIDYARNARWGSQKKEWPVKEGGDGKVYYTSHLHLKKHGSQTGTTSMEQYNMAALNLIRGGKRDVYLTIRKKEHPYPQLYFYEPQTRKFAVVNINGQNLATYFIISERAWRSLCRKSNVMIKLKGGFMKWIESVFI